MQSRVQRHPDLPRGYQGPQELPANAPEMSESLLNPHTLPSMMYTCPCLTTSWTPSNQLPASFPPLALSSLETEERKKESEKVGAFQRGREGP